MNFSYPTRPTNRVMSGFSIEIEPGQTVALVGESGQGKSTLLHLIQRFYDINGGKILLDGTPINQLNIQWLRSKIGLVSQEKLKKSRNKRPSTWSGSRWDRFASPLESHKSHPHSQNFTPSGNLAKFPNKNTFCP